MSPEQEAHAKEIAARLAAFFEPREHKWKPAVVSGNRAMALCYVDARVIQDRLDDVCGVTGWQDEYTVDPSGSVVCKLSLLIAGDWITKMDVGSQSEQPDDGDKLKAAFSDALKRAAVKFGIGRYLYRLPSQWVDYDPTKKKFTATPKLPDFVTGGTADRPAHAVKSPLLAQNRAALEMGAKGGSACLAAAWKSLSPESQKACLALKESLKSKAAEVDRAKPA